MFCANNNPTAASVNRYHTDFRSNSFFIRSSPFRVYPPHFIVLHLPYLPGRSGDHLMLSASNNASAVNVNR